MTKRIFIITTILGCLLPNILSAQIDVKLDPISALAVRNAKAGVEFGINNNIGIDLVGVYSFNTNIPIIGISVGGSGFGARLIPKYYFSTKKGLDRFYVGPYIKYKYTTAPGFVFQRAAAGIYTGYKIVANNNIFFDIGFGFGRRIYRSLEDDLGTNLGDELEFGGIFAIDLDTKFAVGYRFGGTNSMEQNPSTGKQRNRDQNTIEGSDDVRQSRKKSSNTRKKKKKKKGKKRRN